jgi:hypothetical protein
VTAFHVLRRRQKEPPAITSLPAVPHEAAALRGSSSRNCSHVVLSVMRQALKAALIGAIIIVLAEGGMAATIMVHEPDGEGRVFVDVVGQINDDDFKTFKEKADQIYPSGSGHPNKQVIVTLMSYGGSISSGLQTGITYGKRVYPPSSLAIARARAHAHSSGLPEGPERSVILHT